MTWLTSHWQEGAAGLVVLIAIASIARRVRRMLQAAKDPSGAMHSCSGCPKSRPTSKPAPPVVGLGVVKSAPDSHSRRR